MYSSAQQKKLFALSQKLLKKNLTKSDVEDLQQVLRFHEWKYAVQNDPIITDTEYDLLFHGLSKLESENPELVTEDSPTQRVTSDLSDGFPSVQHLSPMLSLGNAYNLEDLQEFDQQIRKLVQKSEDETIEYCVEPKFDGGSIAVVFKEDLYLRGATRGNGQEGEDITLNLRTLPSIPLKAAFAKHGIHTAELRGEAVIRKNTFDVVNEKRAAENKTLFANPRNAATGGLRMKKPNETKERGIEVFMFQLSHAVGKNGDPAFDNINGHFEQIELLGKLGFKIPTIEKKLCKSIEEAHTFIQSWEEKRDSYHYEIDGMVVKVNSKELQARCGSTAHHPRWATAYKFKAKQATSKLLTIEYQVGKIGSITPVAKIEPVQLAGVTVSSISLHNAEFIASKDIRIGDTLLIERAGDVIPYIVKSFPELRDGSEKPLAYPSVCPINTTDTEVPLVQVEGEAAWRCVDCQCGQQDLQKIIFHVSKPAMDIDGFGKSYVERFHSEGWMNDISDVYSLDYDRISQLEGFGQRSAAKLKSAIDKARANPIHRLLHSLSIHHLGKKASKLIAQEIDHVLDLQHWTEEKFTDIKDIGPVVAERVLEYFSRSENIDLLQRMEDRGVNMRQLDEDRPKEQNTEGVLYGKTVLFTGTLTQMGRKEAQQKAEDEGGKIMSGVSSKLNVLIVGEKAGSKLKKAQALGSVEIWTEEEFIIKIGS